MADFYEQVQMVLDEIHKDVVFRVNFKNCAYLAIEDVLGQDIDDELAYAIIAAVRARLATEIRNKEHYRQQIIQMHLEHETSSHELERTFKSHGL